jgi:hypothetical protein
MVPVQYWLVLPLWAVAVAVAKKEPVWLAVLAVVVAVSLPPVRLVARGLLVRVLPEGQ